MMEPHLSINLELGKLEKFFSSIVRYRMMRCICWKIICNRNGIFHFLMLPSQGGKTPDFSGAAVGADVSIYWGLSDGGENKAAWDNVANNWKYLP